MSRCRLRIGIDVRLAHWPGIGRYIDEIVGRMVADQPGTDFVLFGNVAGPTTLQRYADPALRERLHAPNVRFVDSPVTPFSPIEPLALGSAAREAGVHVMHSPYINIPWLSSGGPRLVTTLHDFRHPDLALRLASPRSWAKRAYYETLTRLALSRSRRLVCVSEFLAGQVRAFRPSVAARLVVVPHAAGDVFRPLPAAQAAADVASWFGLQGRYFLFVGTLKPHKNLIAAASALAQPRVPADVQLAVAAAPDRRYPDFQAAVAQLGLERRVRLLGHVEKERLPALYNAARATVLPSSYESFGLPMVESMACGTPVIAAPLASLPEVGAAAAWYATPTPGAIAAVMDEALHDDASHARHREAGLRRAREFSWQRAAGAMHEIYRQVASEANGAAGNTSEVAP